MMTRLSLLIFLAVSVALSSCTSSSEFESRSTQNYSNCFHYVYDLSEGEAGVFASPHYTIEWNYGKAKADLELKNARFAENMPQVNLKIKDLRWSISSGGWKVINATDVVPEVNGQPMPAYMINQLKIEVLDRYVGAVFEPIVNIYFTINGRYAVTAVQKSVIYFGNTNVTESGETYKTSSPYYRVRIEDDLTADVTIYDAEFEKLMTPEDLVLKDAQVQINSGIGYALSGTSVATEVGGKPSMEYNVTNLLGHGTFSGGLNMTFNCEKKTTTTEGTEDVNQYYVQANLTFLPEEEAEY